MNLWVNLSLLKNSDAIQVCILMYGFVNSSIVLLIGAPDYKGINAISPGLLNLVADSVEDGANSIMIDDFREISPPYSKGPYWRWRQHIHFSKELHGEAKRFLSSWKTQGEFVSLHMRRGEILSEHMKRLRPKLKTLSRCFAIWLLIIQSLKYLLLLTKRTPNWTRFRHLWRRTELICIGISQDTMASQQLTSTLVLDKPSWL